MGVRDDVGRADCALAGLAVAGDIEAGDGSGTPAKSAKSVFLVKVIFWIRREGMHWAYRRRRSRVMERAQRSLLRKDL